MRQPTLHDLFHAPRPERVRTDQLEVYDLFAGAGGFSQGAVQAGCRVAWACDVCPRALETHRINHPNTEHKVLTLPSPEVVACLPTDGRRFHVHASPPCVKLTAMNHLHKPRASARAAAVELVEWSLDTMLNSSCTSWSLEQVRAPEVLAALKRARRTWPGRVAWMVLDCSLLGVPQTRKRLLAGSPRLIARLRRAASVGNRLSVRSVLPAPRGTHVRQGCTSSKGSPRKNRQPGQTKFEQYPRGWDQALRSVDRLSFTVRGGHALCWVTLDGKGKVVDRSVLRPCELAALQTFPADYKWPVRKMEAYRQVGNAVPPLVAERLLEGEATGSA